MDRPSLMSESTSSAARACPLLSKVLIVRPSATSSSFRAALAGLLRPAMSCKKLIHEVPADVPLMPPAAKAFSVTSTSSKVCPYTTPDVEAYFMASPMSSMFRAPSLVTWNIWAADLVTSAVVCGNRFIVCISRRLVTSKFVFPTAARSAATLTTSRPRAPDTPPCSSPTIALDSSVSENRVLWSILRSSSRMTEPCSLVLSPSTSRNLMFCSTSMPMEKVRDTPKLMAEPANRGARLPHVSHRRLKPEARPRAIE